MISALRPQWIRLRSSPLGYRLASGMFWTMTGAVVSRGSALAGSVLVAQSLGKEGFGQYGIIQSTVGMFGVFAGFGMGLTATKHVAQYRAIDPSKAGRILALTEMVTIAASLLVVLALLVSATFLATHTLAAPALAPLLMVGGLLVPFSALEGVQNGALAGLEAFRRIAQANMLTGLLSIPLTVGGAYLWGIQGAVCGVVASQMVNCMLRGLALRVEAAHSGMPLRWVCSTREIPVLWSFGVPTALSNATSWCANWICAAMLVNQPNGYSEMGIVTAGNQWRAALMFVPMLFINATLPMLANESGTETGVFGRLMDLSHKLLFLAVLPITLIMMLCAGGIMHIYGNGFGEGRQTLIYVLAAAAVASVTSPLGSAIIAKGRMQLSFALNALHSAVFVLVAYLIIPSLGAMGLAIAYLAASVLQTIAGYSYLRAEIPAGILWRVLSVVFAICALAYAITQTTP